MQDSSAYLFKNNCQTVFPPFFPLYFSPSESHEKEKPAQCPDTKRVDEDIWNSVYNQGYQIFMRPAADMFLLCLLLQKSLLGFY